MPSMNPMPFTAVDIQELGIDSSKTFSFKSKVLPINR